MYAKRTQMMDKITEIPGKVIDYQGFTSVLDDSAPIDLLSNAIAEVICYIARCPNEQ